MSSALPKAADVVVVGGGVLGCSAAFHLADSGYKNVVLLDRGPLANGTTPFAAGQTGHLPTDRSLLKFVMYCIDFLEQFRQRTGFAIDYRQSGSMRIALSDASLADLDARVAAAKEAGQEAELISADRAKQMVPLLNLGKTSGILFVPRDGYVEPKSVAVAFAAAARDRGAIIRTHTPVVGLEISAGQVRAVRTSRGTIETNHVVLATGAWTRQFGDRVGLNIKVVPVRHQAFVTAPLAGILPQQPIVRIIEHQIYVREEEGELLVGGYGYRPTSFDMNDFPPSFQMPSLEADQIYYVKLREAAANFFPTLRDAPVVQERQALPTMSADSRLIVSELDEVKGLIIASACGVGGIFQSPGVGWAVAELANGRSSSLPIDFISGRPVYGPI